MKSILLTFIVSICVLGAVAQPYGSSEFKKKFNKADALVYDESYSEAIPLLEDLYAVDTTNANLNHLLGLAYMLGSREYDKAIHLLESASRSVALDYNEANWKEKRAPGKTYFYLGKAYHYKNRFDRAVNNYYNYRSFISMDDVETYNFVRQQIQYAENAMELIKDPINVQVTNLGPNINTKYPEYCPVVPADEQFLIFTSRREGSTGGQVDDNGAFFDDIYVSQRKPDGTWSKPAGIPNINTPAHEAAIGLSPDGQLLFIYKDDNGGDIYFSELDGSVWSTPQPMASDINTDARETHATISSRKDLLVFTSDRSGGYGGRDLWYSKRLPNGEWGLAQNMGSVVNSSFDDDSPFLTADGNTLIFSSQGHTSMGGFDIFRTELVDGEWTEPENIGYPINTSEDDVFLSLAPSGVHGYYSSRMEGGFGDTDIYRIRFDSKKASAVAVVKGVMKVPAKDYVNLEAKVEVSDAGGAPLGVFRPNSNTGYYVLTLPPGETYTISYQVDGYDPVIKQVPIASDEIYPEYGGVVELDEVVFGEELLALQEEKRAMEEAAALAEQKALEQEMKAAEAAAKAKEEAARLAKEQAEQKAEAEELELAEEMAMSEREEAEAKLKAEQEKAAKAEAEAAKAEEELLAEQARQEAMANAEAKAKADQEAAQKAQEAEAKTKAEQEAVLAAAKKAEEEAAEKAREEAADKAEAEAKEEAERIAALAAAKKAEEEVAEKARMEAEAEATPETETETETEEAEQAQNREAVDEESLDNKQEEQEAILEAAEKRKQELKARIAELKRQQQGQPETEPVVKERESEQQPTVEPTAEEAEPAPEKQAEPEPQTEAELEQPVKEVKMDAPETVVSSIDVEEIRAKRAEMLERIAELKRKQQEAAQRKEAEAERLKNAEAKKEDASEEKQELEEQAAAKREQIAQLEKELAGLEEQVAAKEEVIAKSEAEASEAAAEVERQAAKERELKEQQRQQEVEMEKAEARLEALKEKRAEAEQLAQEQKQEEERQAAEQAKEELMQAEALAEQQKQVQAALKAEEEKRRKIEAAEEKAFSQKEILENAANLDQLRALNEQLIQDNLELKIQLAQLNEKLDVIMNKLDDAPDLKKVEVPVKTTMQRLETGSSLILRNIFFDYNQATLRPRSRHELNRLYEFLKENPKAQIVVGGHTDSKGDADYNMRLSKQRAQAVVDYMIRNGIDPSRLQAIGHGEGRPIARNENADGSDNPVGRQLNRRIEISLPKGDVKGVEIQEIEVPENAKID